MAPQLKALGLLPPLIPKHAKLKPQQSHTSLVTPQKLLRMHKHTFTMPHAQSTFTVNAGRLS
jgi:hypothetical protein